MWHTGDMTTAADGPSRGYRLTMWLAHHEPHILAVVVITTTADYIARRYAGGDLTTWNVTNVLATLALVAMLCSFHAARRHEHALCWRCARNTPLDGPAAAARHDRALRLWHWCHSGSGLIAIAALLVVLIVGGLFLRTIPTAAPLFTLFAVEAAAGLRHRPLQPWCPQCQGRRRWDEGGDPEPSPTPDPSEARERV